MSEYIEPGARIADPMCGTAAISAKLRQQQHPVVAGDLMTYSAHHARTRLLFDRPPQFATLGMKYEEVIQYLNLEVPPRQGLFYHEYSPAGAPVSGTEPRKYFTPENAMRIDGILWQLKLWKSSIPELLDSVLRHDLILAVNSIANIAGTYGHYRSTFSKGTCRPLTITPSQFLSARTDHVVEIGQAADTLRRHEVDAVYLDPPYKKRQYAANYHILETIARGDTPTPVGVSGLRDWWPEYSDFCSKTKIEEAFHELFSATNSPLFFVSYSEDGLISDTQIREILSAYGSLERYTLKHSRFKSNKGGIGGTLNEYLYVIRR